MSNKNVTNPFTKLEKKKITLIDEKNANLSRLSEINTLLQERLPHTEYQTLTNERVEITEDNREIDSEIRELNIQIKHDEKAEEIRLRDLPLITAIVNTLILKDPMPDAAEAIKNKVSRAKGILSTIKESL